jgi:D-alanyl-D-alanine carboxypeptidase (penicillin-binding protein 5/6)
VVRAGQVMGTVRVRRGRLKRVEAVARRGVFYTLPKSEPLPAVAAQLPKEVVAPVARGQVLGQVTVKRAAGDRLGVSLVAGRPVAAVGVAELFWQFLRTIVGAPVGLAQ